MYVVVNRNKEGNHWMPFLGSFRHDKKSVSFRKRTKMCQCINHVAHFWQCKHDIFIQCCSIISMSYACANAEKSFPGRGEGGVWRFLDIISFWCRATDLHLLKRELNFAIKILFILLVDRRWKPKVSLAHLLTEDQLADFFSFWWLILALFLILITRERLLILKYDPRVCTLCLFLSFAVHLFWNWQSLWSGFHTSLSRQQAWRYWSLFAFYSVPLVSGQCLVL